MKNSRSQRLKWRVEHKKLENKPRNGVNSYYNIRDDSEITEPLLIPNSLDTPTLDKCPDKELKETIFNDTENITFILIRQVKVITTELEAIKGFVKEQFYLKINKHSEAQRNNKFIELLKQQNKTLVEKSKSILP